VGGVGSLACQMAKNIFGAAKAITTVSTEKVGKADKLLGNGVVDRSLSILL
jgi:NADPH:quinone reductase-like Zn-dependent oxidoreductase